MLIFSSFIYIYISISILIGALLAWDYIIRSSSLFGNSFKIFFYVKRMVEILVLEQSPHFILLLLFRKTKVENILYQTSLVFFFFSAVLLRLGTR